METKPNYDILNLADLKTSYDNLKPALGSIWESIPTKTLFFSIAYDDIRKIRLSLIAANDPSVYLNLIQECTLKYENSKGRSFSVVKNQVNISTSLDNSVKS